MNIGVDVDDVLAEFQPGWIDYHNAIHGSSMTVETMTDYNYSISFKIPGEIIFPRVHDFYKTEGFENLVPVDGSIKFIKKLSKKHNLFAITARPDTTVDLSLIWIKKHYGEVFKEIVFCNHYSQDPNIPKQLKSDICKLHRVDIFIEDALHNAKDVASSGTKVLLLDKPWNRKLIEHENIIRVANWNEAYNYVNNISKIL